MNLKNRLIKSITLCDKAYNEGAIKKVHPFIHVKNKKPWFKPWRWCNEFVYLVVDHKNKTVDLVVRGTEGVAWLDNGDVLPISDLGVMDGFHDGFEFIRSALFNLIDKYRREYTFKIQGHSRGGPLALQVAYWMDKYWYSISEVIIWDAPRSGTMKWKIFYNSTTLRDKTICVNMKNSLVTHAPPKNLFGKKFVRVPKKLIILDNKKEGFINSLLNHRPKEILKALLNTEIKDD